MLLRPEHDGPGRSLQHHGQHRTISALLHEAAETHHIVYRNVDGDDPDWGSWYADSLIEHSELPTILGQQPVRSHLAGRLPGLVARV